MSEVIYLDTSVLLSLLFQDSNAQQALHIWEDSNVRVGSFLTSFECYSAIHRQQVTHKKIFDKRWMKNSLEWVQRILDQVSLHTIDETILAVIKHDSLLYPCKTLDRIHLATAMHFQREMNTKITLATFDIQMQKLAVSLGISVIK